VTIVTTEKALGEVEEGGRGLMKPADMLRAVSDVPKAKAALRGYKRTGLLRGITGMMTMVKPLG